MQNTFQIKSHTVPLSLRDAVSLRLRECVLECKSHNVSLKLLSNVFYFVNCMPIVIEGHVSIVIIKSNLVKK